MENACIICIELWTNNHVVSVTIQSQLNRQIIIPSKSKKKFRLNINLNIIQTHIWKSFQIIISIVSFEKRVYNYKIMLEKFYNPKLFDLIHGLLLDLLAKPVQSFRLKLRLFALDYDTISSRYSKLLQEISNFSLKLEFLDIYIL